MNESSLVARPLSEDDVEAIFQLLLRRSVGNEDYRRSVVESGMTLAELISQLRASAELQGRVLHEAGAAPPPLIDDFRFRIPQQLRVSSYDPSRILLVGSCLLAGWPGAIKQHNPSVQVDIATFNNASELPPIDAFEAASITFQVVQIPLRSVLPEALFFGVKLADPDGYRHVLETALQLLKRNLEAALSYNSDHGIETILLNFAKPQQDPDGRFADPYALTNLTGIVDELNREIVRTQTSRRNCYLLDYDGALSTFGKKYLQDDTISHSNHGALLVDIQQEGDEARLEPAGNVRELYGSKLEQFVIALFEEALAIDRSVRRIDEVKLVVFDLDDTLWRGVVAELDHVHNGLVEGWPLGIVEAAAALWRRGILIAIVSKNDEQRVGSAWERLYGLRFPLENFVSRKINWRAKPDNIRDILAEVNILPENTLFVDDNPIEREAVRQAIPGIRILDAPLAEWRRILLWSAETQVAHHTDESGRRTEMIQAQIARGESEETMDRAEFLRSLDLELSVHIVTGSDDGAFPRCLELLNKTNQFNTTGRKWRHEELARLVDVGGKLIVLSARDRFTDYGIISVFVVTGSCIDQIVLSCRVFGMEVEHSGLAIAMRLLRDEDFEEALIRAEETGRNNLALAFLQAEGLEERATGQWLARLDQPFTLPAHVTLHGFETAEVVMMDH